MSEFPDRYARQLVLPMIGAVGQQRLAEARVVVIGCGATGTVIANHLARAGVGFLRIVDRDWVEATNLQRQLLFDEADAREGAPKAIAAARHLRAVNSAIQVEGTIADVSAATVESLVEGCDLAMDGTDNFETRYVLNDACVKQGKPWVYTGAVATYGMTMLVRPGLSPCLRCIFPELPPAGTAATCDTAGVLGPAVGVVASLAAVEAIKYLVDAEDVLAAGLIQVDVWDLSWHVLRLARTEQCPCCGEQRFPFLEPGTSSHATTLCGRNAVQITPSIPANLDLAALAERLRPLGEVTRNQFLLRFHSGDHQLTVFPDGRAVIQGTTDETVARSLYARYVGS